MSTWRQELLSTIAEYQYYCGTTNRFDLVDFLAEHASVNSYRQFIDLLKAHIYQAIKVGKGKV